MRDLDLLNRWLVQERQHALQFAHSVALSPAADLVTLRSVAMQAEFCDRVRAAAKVLANDPGKFIKDYLGGEGERDE